MASYIDKNLGPGEVVRYTARLSLWRFPLYFFFGGLLGVAMVISLFAVLSAHSPPPPGVSAICWILLLIAILVFVWPFIARRSTELVITDKRLIVKYGLVSTQSIEIRFSKIETVRVSQGLVGKMFNYGDIVVTGTGSTFDPIRSIRDPLAFRAALSNAMEVSTANGVAPSGSTPASALG